ncbi:MULTISPECIES: hypothetical protein [unclassified Bradyrhizobium]|uniref:hypothetical protein n=1 Tax=unclassified Bradyrhizobium TaxID=2631580 RepID=UPI001CD5B2EF|nr:MULTISPECIES: hypothetical protein [unclassified Bradyrhizobium]MCA1385647.1 hypothetical protein [Bradyrhizobium sp. BRP05]MCA1394410.1 hypothetical protein [Bradyrhizobium sp. IC3123]MCA1423942.1 hypothetical protein [Bradyrhizobium sp. BRP23]MCA1430960.1 hypothetical protein [Bradyrhizobium sp. NBAIM16]MCA1438496.1 hypothetical protein [Bradyrhizobium sp. BRP20]
MINPLRDCSTMRVQDELFFATRGKSASFCLAANASFVAVWVQADHFLAAQKVIQIATAVRRHRTICTKYCGFGR